MQPRRLPRSLRLPARALALALATLLSSVSGPTQSLPASSAQPQPHVVMIGGGSSHDFDTNYRETDVARLRKAGLSVQYTDSFQDLATNLAGANTLIQASNQAAPVAPSRRTLMSFVSAGGGLVAVHAATWYNWPDWPDYNRLLIGGGTRDHDRPARFEVTVTAPSHPVMSGVPTRFSIEDELYHQEFAPGGPPIEVLATAHSPLTGKNYPSVWIVKGQKGRIVCIALGHDERSHEAPAYQTILANAAKWTSEGSNPSVRKP